MCAGRRRRRWWWRLVADVADVADVCYDKCDTVYDKLYKICDDNVQEFKNLHSNI